LPDFPNNRVAALLRFQSVNKDSSMASSGQLLSVTNYRSKAFEIALNKMPETCPSSATA